MKKTVLHLVCAFTPLLLSIASYSQSKKPEQMVKFKKEEYDLGKIKEGMTGNVDLDFDNISQDTIKSLDISTRCCGITQLYRESVLDAYLFFDLYQVKQITDEWIEEYNKRRPHEALNNLTPSLIVITETH